MHALYGIVKFTGLCFTNEVSVVEMYVFSWTGLYLPSYCPIIVDEDAFITRSG